MIEWSQLFIAMSTASFVWLFLPLFVRPQHQQTPSWLRWLAYLPPIAQLLCNGLIAGGAAAMLSAVVRSIQGRELSDAPLLYALGWVIGTLVVGGWQLSRGRFPLVKPE